MIWHNANRHNRHTHKKKKRKRKGKREREKQNLNEKDTSNATNPSWSESIEASFCAKTWKNKVKAKEKEKGKEKGREREKENGNEMKKDIAPHLPAVNPQSNNNISYDNLLLKKSILYSMQTPYGDRGKQISTSKASLIQTQIYLSVKS